MKQPKRQQNRKRDTLHIFDRTIKYLLHETSPVNTVLLVNALFDRHYAHNSPVRFEKTEKVRKRGKTLDLFHADILLNVAGDDFAIEFQMGNGEIIGLRLFEYGFRLAHGTKRMFGNGELIEMDLPDACVVFFENTKNTPGHITFRLKIKTGESFDYKIRVFKMEEQTLESLERQRLLLLLPFCLLRFRKELERVKSAADGRREIAQKERQTLDELENVLVRVRESGFLGTDDGILILESISQMHEELYGTYQEFQEANMVVDERIKLRWAPYKRKLIKETRAETKAETESRIIGLFKQGHTVEEVEALLARERAEEVAGTSPDTPR